IACSRMWIWRKGQNNGIDQNNATLPPATQLYDSSCWTFDNWKYPANEGTGEVTGDATRSTLDTTLANYQKTLGSSDSLFIFTTGHGNNDAVNKGVVNSTYMLWNQGEIDVNNFTKELPTTPSNITLVMEQCYSGGFAWNFTSGYTGPQHRILETAASPSQTSWGNGFSNAWMEGAARVNDNLQQNFAADQNQDGQISMQEAFNWAFKNDPYSTGDTQTGINAETPQYSDPANAGLTQFLSYCTATGPLSITLTNPSTPVTWNQGYSELISWVETPGLASARMTISLWQGSTPATATLIQSFPVSAGMTSYNWVIPSTQALTPPNYYINVTSVGTTPLVNSTDSPAIQIAAGGKAGILWINSTPVQGATISIDNTPSLNPNSLKTNNSFSSGVNGLTLGSHTVQVSLTGYYSQSATVNIPSRSTAAQNFPLVQAPPNDVPPYGNISVDSNPEGAEVIIDGADTGLTTPAVLQELSQMPQKPGYPATTGLHTVDVTSYGYTTPQTLTVTVFPHLENSTYFPLTLASDVAPVLGQLNVPTSPVAVNTQVDAYTTLTHPNNGDTFTAVWTWGDGTTTSMNLPAGTTQFDGFHTYTTAGMYTVSVTVTVNSNSNLAATATAQPYLIVYTPKSGYVLGAGSFTSPKGAYVANPSLTGKADFGI